jgi:hypothetical protein
MTGRRKISAGRAATDLLDELRDMEEKGETTRTSYALVRGPMCMDALFRYRLRIGLGEANERRRHGRV